MSRKKRASPWTVAEARAALKELATSGLSVSEYAQREGLETDRLYRWRRRCATEHEPVAEAPVAAPSIIELRAPTRRAEPVEIVLASGATLRVAETIDPSALARLVAALR